MRGRENADLKMRRTELARIEHRIRKLVALIIKDDAPVRALKAELRTLEIRQAELERELTAAPAQQPSWSRRATWRAAFVYACAFG